MSKIRVMVTGSGSGVGQGIIKALRLSKLQITVIAADINAQNSGFLRADEAVLIPKVEDLEKPDLFIGILIRNKVDVLMIGSEYDLSFFARHKKEIENNSKTIIIISPESSIKIADDKYLTASFLSENHIAKSDFWAPENKEAAIKIFNNYKKPMILKSRTGTSQRNVHIVRDEKDLSLLYNKVPNPMLQEILALPKNQLDKEYTCSIFKCKDGTILGPFTSRRTLKSGNSWIVEVDQFKDIFPLMLKIGRKFSTIGSLNVQLMMTSNGPVPFEFNARFSGTTAIRAHYGFNEPEMAIKNYYLNENIENPKIRTGTVFKYFEEVFVDNMKFKDVKSFHKKGLINKWF